MKTLIIGIIFLGWTFITLGQNHNGNICNESQIPSSTSSQKSGDSKKYKVFRINFDWMLETKTELINGIWYSPMLGFNLKTKQGFNFQLQAGALPMLKGFQLYRSNPSAGISVGYRF
ncbi:MAG: hypothetical protein WDZ35_12675 [Crocinitomicaceae bacterium]